MNALEKILMLHKKKEPRRNTIKHRVLSALELQDILNNPPFNTEELGSPFGNQTILSKSYERKKKGGGMISPVSQDIFFKSANFAPGFLDKINSAMPFWDFCKILMGKEQFVLVPEEVSEESEPEDTEPVNPNDQMSNNDTYGTIRERKSHHREDDDDQPVNLREMQNERKTSKKKKQKSDRSSRKKFDIFKKMEYSHDLLYPLTKLQGEIKSVGIKVFRLIYKICEDRRRPMLPYYKVRKLIQVLLTSPSEVKDEFYLQMIKQLRSNPYNHNNLNEWVLFAIVAGFLTPSEGCLFPLLKYIHNVYESSHNQEARSWAAYTMRRLHMTQRNGERSVLPCLEEIRAIQHRRQVGMEIFYLNGASQVFQFESYTTVQDLKDQLIQRFGFDSHFESCIGLYEICKKPVVSEENYVEDPVKVISQFQISS